LVPSSISWIISSGGALEEVTAKWWKEKGYPLIEVLGSTETGGLAQRSYGASYPAWAFFEEVELKNPSVGVLNGPEVRSPFTGVEDWVTMGDNIKMQSDLNRFNLIGRTDQIVKVQEKRVSLREFEAALLELCGIDEVRFLLTPGDDGRLKAVVKMTKTSLAEYIEQGHSRTTRVWANFLREKFDAVVIPRQWRVVRDWPTNEVGKTTQEALQLYFEKPFSSTEVFPYLLSLRRENEILELSLEVPTHLKYFKGHFPGTPLVAGVVQLSWIEQACREHLDLNGPVKRILRLKFKSIILPGQKIVLSLKYHTEGHRVEASFLRDEVDVSSCCLVFGQPT
jgi:3-hydroxymyristoyl/3-hydroxydecanoyl-(acyl carrier protein) dehydratase